MKSLTIILTLTAATAAQCVTAQNLAKDITIERQLNQTLRAATRLGATPSLLQPEVKVDPLKFSEIVLTAETGVNIDTLPAVAPAPAVTLSPYRGYASIGYFPAYNLGVSAGYRAIDKRNTSLGIWTQFDGVNYKLKGDDAPSLGSNAITIGADLTTIINHAGRLDLSVDFTYDNLYGMYGLNNGIGNEKADHYGVTMLNTDIHWSARNAMMAYYITGDYHLYSTSNTILPGVTQHDYNARGGTAYFLTENTQLAGSFGIDFLSTNHYMLTTDQNMVINRSAPKTLGLINFDPAFRYKNDKFKLNLGLRLQFMSHMSKSVNLAPDIHLYVTPATWVSAFATLTGGKQFNTLAHISEWCRWINPAFAYEASNIPLDAMIGVTVGPFNGFSATVKGGYAMANEWLMPAIATDNEGNIADNGVILSPVDLRAFHAQAELAYRHSSLFEGKISYQIAPGSLSHAYMINRDRAKGVLTIEAQSSPIDRLNVNASFTVRHGRSLYLGPTRFDISAYNSLDLGAQYRLTPSFTIFAQFENILNCRAPQTWMVDYQGIHGAIGAAIKF